MVIPPASMLSVASAAVWYGAEAVTGMRFHLPGPQTYRWANLYVSTASGNIQVVVARLTRSGTTVTASPVMNSGVIACPAAGNQRIDLTATALTVGDYALGLWCDNTTAQFLHATSTPLAAARLAFSTTRTGGISTGSFTFPASGRWVTGLTLETDS